MKDALIVGFILAIVTPVISKFIPEKDKIIYYFKKLFYLLFSFGMPIFFLCALFLSDSVVDKKFVYEVALFVAVLFFNIIMHIQTRVLKLFKLQVEVNKGTHDFQIKHAGVTEKIVDVLNKK